MLALRHIFKIIKIPGTCRYCVVPENIRSYLKDISENSRGWGGGGGWSLNTKLLKESMKLIKRVGWGGGRVFMRESLVSRTTYFNLNPR